MTDDAVFLRHKFSFVPVDCMLLLMRLAVDVSQTGELVSTMCRGKLLFNTFACFVI